MSQIMQQDLFEACPVKGKLGMCVFNYLMVSNKIVLCTGW